MLARSIGGCCAMGRSGRSVRRAGALRVRRRRDRGPRLFVASGDAVTFDGRLGANQVRRAVELHGQTTAAVHLARSAAYFDQHEEGGVKE